jgi:nitroreductase
MSKEVLRFITVRRSIRAFTGEAVDRAKLEIALKAAMAAPSANNSKPWEFVVVTDQEKVRTICETHPYAKFGTNAGAVVLPFGKKAEYQWFDQDMGAATENLLIALANLGLGATWCGMSDERQAAVRELVEIPDDLYVFALIPVGIPSEGVPARTQYEAKRVHWERF